MNLRNTLPRNTDGTAHGRKAHIRASFDRAAATYDSAADIQREVVRQLLQRLDDTAGAAADTPAPARLLDAGCGTGYGSGLLQARWPQAELIGVDFAAAMVRSMLAAPAASRSPASGQRHGLVADIEALPLAAGSIALWWSSLAMQWANPQRCLSEAARVLAPGGRLALSTLGPDTFVELRQCFAGIDPHRHTLDFESPARLQQALVACGFVDITLCRHALQTHHPDLKQLLGAIKAIGANSLGPGRRSGMMGRKTWAALVNAYETCRQTAGLPTTYDVILVTARRAALPGTAQAEPA